MSEIYGNSHVTLAAEAAENPHSGCFSQAPKSCLAQETPAAFHDDGVVIPVLLRQRLNHRGSSLHTLPQNYQERLISRRTIYFDPMELVWEWIDCVDCECRSPMNGLTDPIRLPTESEVVNREEIPRQWHRIVSEYSRMILVSSHNALPAISGVAQVIGRYVADLWRDSILTDLLWYDTIVKPNKPSEEQWITPTWSLASTISNRWIDLLSAGQNLAEVIDAVAKPSGKDIYGEIDHACLRLHAKAASILIQKTGPQDEYGVSFENKDGTQCQLDQTICSLLGLNYHFLNPDMHQLEAKALLITQYTRLTFPYDISKPRYHIPRDWIHPKEAQTCLLMARDRAFRGRWKRAGLMVIAEYEIPRPTEESPGTRICSIRALNYMRFKRLRNDAMQQLFDEGVEAQRALRGILDESPSEEFTLW